MKPNRLKNKPKSRAKNKILYTILAIALIAAVFGVVIINLASPQQYTFKDGFNEILKLDKKYNASFYTEALDVENAFSDYKIYDFDWNRTIVSLSMIDAMQSELAEMKGRINKTKEGSGKDAVIIMIDSRIKMLESEKLYQLGLQIGDEGDAYHTTFRCGEKPYILKLSNLFNESTIIGQDATRIWDSLLTYHPQTRPFLSKDARPKFYDSPFWPIRKYSMRNKGVVEELCPE